MQRRGGEAEGSDRGAPAERRPRGGHGGENQGPAHAEESPAVAQRVLQVLAGHPAPVPRRRGGLGSALLLKTTRERARKIESQVRGLQTFGADETLHLHRGEKTQRPSVGPCELQQKMDTRMLSRRRRRRRVRR